MHIKTSWQDSWKAFVAAPKKTNKKQVLTEASEAFVGGVQNWIEFMTDGGEVPLGEVLPWGKLFNNKMRIVIPATSTEDENLAAIVEALKKEGWHPFLDGFPVKISKQKKKRLGTGEVYEVEETTTLFELGKRVTKVIPKGPRQGEETTTLQKARMGKLIQRSPDISPELKKWWAQKQTFYAKTGNADKVQRIFTHPNSDSKYSIIISRHPIDVLRMGDIETMKGKIGHCHQEGGEYQRCAMEEALGHGPIAYLVDKKQLNYLLGGKNKEEREETFGDYDIAPESYTPLDISYFDNQEIFRDQDRNIDGIRVENRLRLREYYNEATHNFWAVPEVRVYPSNSVVPGFSSAVQNWAWESQKEQYEAEYTPGTFPNRDDLRRMGGSYADTRDGALLNLFFKPASPDEAPYNPEIDVEHIPEESEEIGLSSGMRADQWENEVQEIMDTMNQRMEHSSVHAEVEVMDEGNIYVMMSGATSISFDEELFENAEFGIPTNWADLNELSKSIVEAWLPHYAYFDDFHISHTSKTVDFSFYIAAEDIDPTPDGFSSFADMVETQWDNNYSSLRSLLKRLLIKEKYITPDAYEKLSQKIQTGEEDEKHYRFWDVDEEFGEIVIRLLDQEQPNLSGPGGVLIGTVPAITELKKVLPDYHNYQSAAFTDAYIPLIRDLFVKAEESALQQMDLPGMEAKEVHGFLLPSRAKFLIKRHYKNYSDPSDIYLIIKVEIEQEVTDAQTEEIEHFVEFLDHQDSIELLQHAATKVFNLLYMEYTNFKKIEDKISLQGPTIVNSLYEMPLGGTAGLMTLAKNLTKPINNLAFVDLVERTISDLLTLQLNNKETGLDVVNQVKKLTDISSGKTDLSGAAHEYNDMKQVNIELDKFKKLNDNIGVLVTTIGNLIGNWLKMNYSNYEFAPLGTLSMPTWVNDIVNKLKLKPSKSAIQAKKRRESNIEQIINLIERLDLALELGKTKRKKIKIRIGG